jgi:hypothetical protein
MDTNRNTSFGQQLGHAEAVAQQADTRTNSTAENTVGVSLMCGCCGKDFRGRRVRAYSDDKYGIVCGPCVRFRLGGMCGK